MKYYLPLLFQNVALLISGQSIVNRNEDFISIEYGHNIDA